ncbi:MAG TPA: methyltransferase [Cyanobacteria bacterium UBA11372]|nr:methyltransferase [Cyanobacteria bacterium UBA11372]
MNCPICDAPTRRKFKKYGYWIKVCQTCFHQFAELTPSLAHAQQVYGDEYFEGGGAGYPNYLGEAKILRSHSSRYSKILARYMQPGTMLDVGAAAGFILQGFTDCGWKGLGIEPNPRMAEYGRMHLGLPIETGTLEQFKTSDRYDLIAMIQVIPHFFDLKSALHAAEKVTKPNGYWLIETWNRESLMARIFGKNWHEYSPPSVLHWFSPSGLQNLTAQFGFREIARGRPSKWIQASHAKSLLGYKLKGSTLGKLAMKVVNLIPDDLSIPYPSEDLFWALYQKQ